MSLLLLLFIDIIFSSTSLPPSGRTRIQLERPSSGGMRQRWNLARLEANTWNTHSNLIQHQRGAVTPGDEDTYIRRRRQELRGQMPSHLLLWNKVKTALLENSTHAPGPPFYKANAVGLCASGINMQKGVFNAFIIDESDSKQSNRSIVANAAYNGRIWKFIEFSSTECLHHETEYVSFYNFRECTPEEQLILIQFYHRATNQNSAVALRGIMQQQIRQGRPTTPSKEIMGNMSPWSVGPRRPQSAGSVLRLRPIPYADDRFRKLRFVGRSRRQSNFTINRMTGKSDWEEMLASTM